MTFCFGDIITKEPQDLNVFPNPGADHITIQLSGKTNVLGAYLEILAVGGNAMLRRELLAGETSLRLDVDGLSAGMYFISFRNREGIILTRKLSIQR